MEGERQEPVRLPSAGLLWPVPGKPSDAGASSSCLTPCALPEGLFEGFECAHSSV